MATTATVLVSIILIGVLISTATSSAEVAPSLPPSPSTPLIIAILSTLGFQDMAAAATAANLSGAIPTTIFAPTDSSLLTCPSCSTTRLLLEHSVLGLYPLHFLRRLTFGTKIESLAANRCLTVTASASDSKTARKVFINGVEIVKPDFFNNGLIIVHAIQGYVSHLSPLSCDVESMTTLSFPQHASAFSNMRSMLKDAMRGLRVGGYSMVSLAIRVKYSELLELKSMTLFAIDDESVFVDGGRGGGGGQMYVAEMGFHIVPNKILTAADLMRLPSGSKLPTMEPGRNLVVTSAGGGGPLMPMRINFVKVDGFDLVVNNRVAVHGISMPFRRVDNPVKQQFSGQDLDSAAADVPAMR
ncbi:hypothetical protein C2S53_001507 [Perilla frutescens var. hirtella]|uniref:Fasciclin-like arabinogalactan protein 21 n=1 Tax=Perilla frutescens var. hirtella TaxID=608512 RepID=A0AAD4J2N9_PERFH|nr:hypothetical protein C2S53_001507 [Perilla frutescens var. hirtella]